MAGIAGIVWQGVGKTAFGMTFFTIHGLVLAFQGECRAFVIKILHRTGCAEGVLVMTFGAITPEFVFMDVLVATGAIIGTHTQAVLKNSGRSGIHFMAPGTIYLLVFAFQREVGFAVVKFFYPG
jgi:hypothetical protein